MLHRSFKPTKCKTSLKLATSRIKLLKNKKDAQVKQMKRGLAQLLESGQDQTARIRVEHVIREEKTMAAYDLIEIYCELIVARLPIIESQKNCPIDLKEAITSVIFASPRCADIPELLDVRKHFTAKYGKEFITAAVELRPECGVSRMLVEKLSAIAPNGQTKIKVLTAIAEEHNIKWDPESFGEKDSKPRDDLLSGPNTFGEASKMHTELPNFQPPNVQAPPSHDQKHDEPLNFSHQNARSSQGSQNFASTNTGGIKTFAASHPEVRPSGMGAQRMEVEQSFPGDSNDFSFGRQSWNMEFKDATSAAQAAAESAERASMAARAAAELSSLGRITRQYSTESQKSNIHNVREEGPGQYAAPIFPGEDVHGGSMNNSSLDKNSKSKNYKIDGNDHDNLGGAAERLYWDGDASTKRSSRSSSLRPRKSSIDDDSLLNSLKKADRYSEKGSSDEEAVKAEISMKKQSSESNEFVTGQQDGFRSENFSYFGEERIRRQSSAVSSHSHSSTSGDEYSASISNHHKFGNGASEDCVIGNDKESTGRDTDTRQTHSYDAGGAVFYDSGSDDENLSFDTEPKYDEQESKSYISLPDRKLPTYTNSDSWSPRRNNYKSLENSTSQSPFSTEQPSSSEFSETFTKSEDPSQPYDSVPVTFDVSDGSNSESEDQLNKSTPGGEKYASIPPHKKNVYFINPEPTQSENHGLTQSSFAEKINLRFDKKPWLRSSFDDLDPTEGDLKNKQGTELNAESSNKFGLESLAGERSPRLGKSQLELNDMGRESTFGIADEGSHRQSPQSLLHEVDHVRAQQSAPIKGNEFLTQSSLESGKELNFGTLTGGLRNKGYRHPPCTRSPSGEASSSSRKAAEESSTMVEQSTASVTVKNSDNSGVSTNIDNKFSSRVPTAHSDSDTDSSIEEFPQETLSRRRGPNAQKADKKVNSKSTLRAPVNFFDSDSGDSEEDLPQQTLASRNHLGSGFSRRTKASSNSEIKSFSKARVVSGAPMNSNSSADGKPITTRSSYGVETPLKSQFQTLKSSQRGRSEQPISAKEAASKPMPESKISSRIDNLKSSAVEQPSSPPQKTVALRSTESPRSGGTSTGENAAKKVSHVHPKLPDYDTLAAKLQSLRSNQE